MNTGLIGRDYCQSGQRYRYRVRPEGLTLFQVEYRTNADHERIRSRMEDMGVGCIVLEGPCMSV